MNQQQLFKKNEIFQKGEDEIEFCTINVVISHQSFDFGFGYDAKMAISFRQCQTKTKRCPFQSTVIIALPTDTCPSLFKNNNNNKININ
jgi:hypothetical protein